VSQSGLTAAFLLDYSGLVDSLQRDTDVFSLRQALKAKIAEAPIDRFFEPHTAIGIGEPLLMSQAGLLPTLGLAVGPLHNADEARLLAIGKDSFNRQVTAQGRAGRMHLAGDENTPAAIGEQFALDTATEGTDGGPNASPATVQADEWHSAHGGGCGL
jgi:hypothetical protein